LENDGFEDLADCIAEHFHLWVFLGREFLDFMGG
jgi:hypothetical protein